MEKWGNVGWGKLEWRRSECKGDCVSGVIMWSLPFDLSEMQLESIVIIHSRWTARLPIFSLINVSLMFFFLILPATAGCVQRERERERERERDRGRNCITVLTVTYRLYGLQLDTIFLPLQMMAAVKEAVAKGVADFISYQENLQRQ